MTESQDEPEVGLISDDELPEDLQPTDDNPLAKDPDDTEDEESGEPRTGGGGPDMGDPGAPA